MFQLNFAIGDTTPLDLKSERWEFPSWLISAVLAMASPHSQRLFGLPEEQGVLTQIRDSINKGCQDLHIARIEGDHTGQCGLLFLQAEYYHTGCEHGVASLKQHAATLASIWLSRQACIEKSIGYVKAQVQDPRAHMIQFVADSGGKNERKAASAFVTNLSSCPDAGTKAVQLLNLAKMWVTTLLPHVFSKRNRVHYGLVRFDDILRWAFEKSRSEGDLGALQGLSEEELVSKYAMPQARRLLAVPFVGKDVPSKVSEFASPDCVIGFTILSYAYEGLRNSDVKEMIRDHKQSLAKETGPFCMRPSWLRFDSWIHDSTNTDSLLPLELLQVDEMPTQVEIAKKKLCFNWAACQYHMDRGFEKCMHHRCSKLQASGVDLGSTIMFKQRLGFSGTPSAILPKGMLTDQGKIYTDEGTQAHIVGILTNPNFFGYRRVEQPWSVDAILDHVVNPPDGQKFHALIDTGALITGYSNEEVAREALRRGLKDFDAAVFLDPQDRQMVIMRSGGKPVPLESCGVHMSRRFTYYDQAHTTGTDLKQSLDARAATTISNDMTLRDHSQGCWRMRQLGKGQTIEIILVEEVFKLIQSSNNNLHSIPEADQGLRDDTHQVLRDTVSWLIMNGMKSETLQQAALLQQSCLSIYRAPALTDLLGMPLPEQDLSGKGPLFVSYFAQMPADQMRAEEELPLFAETTQMGKIHGGIGQQIESCTIDSLSKMLQAVCKFSNSSGFKMPRDCFYFSPRGLLAYVLDNSIGQSYDTVVKRYMRETKSEFEFEAGNKRLEMMSRMHYFDYMCTNWFQMELPNGTAFANKCTLTSSDDKDAKPKGLSPDKGVLTEQELDKLRIVVKERRNASPESDPESAKRGSTRWLAKMVRVFLEEIQLGIPKDVTPSLSLVDSLKAIHMKHQYLLIEGAVSEAEIEDTQQDARKETDDDEKNEGSGFEGEMVQEQEQQQEVEMEATAVEAKTFESRSCSPWTLSELDHKASTISFQMSDLELPGDDALKLEFPANLRISSNYCFKKRSAEAFRLKNATMVLLTSDVGDLRQNALTLLSLGEAETTHRILQGGNMSEETGVQVALISVSGLPFASNCKKQEYFAQMPEQLDGQLCCFKFFNNEVVFQDAELVSLLTMLGNDRDKRRAYFDRLIDCRRKDALVVTDTPLGVVFRHNGPDKLNEYLKQRESIQKKLTHDNQEEYFNKFSLSSGGCGVCKLDVGGLEALITDLFPENRDQGDIARVLTENGSRDGQLFSLKEFISCFGHVPEPTYDISESSAGAPSEEDQFESGRRLDLGAILSGEIGSVISTTPDPLSPSSPARPLKSRSLPVHRIGDLMLVAGPTATFTSRCMIETREFSSVVGPAEVVLKQGRYSIATYFMSHDALILCCK